MRQPVLMQPGLEDPSPQPPEATPPDAWGATGGRAPAYQTPVVTYSLIAVNVAMGLLTMAITPGGWQERLLDPNSATLLLLGAKYGPAIRGGEYWRLVTATFLHAGLFHLAVNMWALLQLGTLCEVLYGRARFLILYVCSGVMGSFASYELSDQLGVGASGAIFGLLGVAIVFSMKYRRELPRGMADRMRRSLMPVLFINLAITFTIPVIDKYAHVGGLLAGGLLAALTESRTASPERLKREALPVPLALMTAIGLLLYGAWGLAGVVPFLRTYARLEQHRWRDATSEFLALSRSSIPMGSVLSAGNRVAEELAAARQGAEAEAVYRRLLVLKPDDVWALNGLAYLYADVLETHLDEAASMAQKAVAAMPDDGTIVDTLAWVYYKQGKLKQALATQQRAVGLTPDHPGLRYHLGAIEEALGQIPAAREDYEMALRMNPGMPEARLALAKLNARPPRPEPPR